MMPFVFCVGRSRSLIHDSLLRRVSGALAVTGLLLGLCFVGACGSGNHDAPAKSSTLSRAQAEELFWSVELGTDPSSLFAKYGQPKTAVAGNRGQTTYSYECDAKSGLQAVEIVADRTGLAKSVGVLFLNPPRKKAEIMRLRQSIRTGASRNEVRVMVGLPDGRTLVRYGSNPGFEFWAVGAPDDGGATHILMIHFAPDNRVKSVEYVRY